MTKSSTDFAMLVTKFLTNYLPMQRNCSKNTILSYKDTLKLFLIFLSDEKGIRMNKFTMADFTRSIVIEFLEWLRSSKASSSSTANQRLAALKSFAYFSQYESVEWLANLQEIGMIKSKKTIGKDIKYLTESQIKRLINSPDANTSSGIRHRLAMCLLYDTAARVQEICDITLGDIYFGEDPKIRIHGKGNKIRTVPVSHNMASLLEEYINTFFKNISDKNQVLLLNKNRRKMSRDGVEYILEKYSNQICKSDPSFPTNVSPHMIRHSKAMHMLAANIPLVYIRDFLGHNDISTTMIYAKADNDLKNRAINKLAPRLVKEEKFSDWTKDQDLLSFLNSLK